ncbi:M23 family metallopeptidase [Streptomyces atratus]|uniref:M23 family metallopeptidase n=1 Tax=Streptomyces atratus TaxID=1893 RepID=UPI0022551DF1|nr:M23 family metallopeptidase [Streptomyces atratus]MCX5341421.1 M23 family metallopeptidase [Streptomyces atratus]
MNDQHPHAGYAGYDSQATGSFDSDPLFGSLPGSYDGTYGSGYDTGQAGYGGQYDSTQWDTGAHATTSYDAYAPYTADPQQQYAADPTYDTTAIWTPGADYGTAATTAATAAATFAAIPAQGGTPDATGQWDTSGWYQTGQWATTGTAAYDTGAYDATAWNTGATPEQEQQTEQTTQTAQMLHEASATHEAYEAQEAHEAHQSYESYADQDSFDLYEPHPTAEFSLPETETGAEADFDTDVREGAADDTADAAAPDAHRPVSRPAPRGGGGGSRSRRRSPVKRSALLTIAVPSACVMSVAGIAAASVSGLGGEDKKDNNTTMAAADPGSVKPVAANNKLDTQLANLSADAENFADRASRTQERIDLRERQAAEKKKREEAAARKEALRPKFLLPVAQHGLSASFGQAGVNWMSVHTGIDFPVSYGTPVMAATDGTVRTQLNSAYGNMAIVTMADGTETWYCHLSSTKIRSGPVKAGDVIAYSGDSGNSTGPHLHFEVRPGGGAAIDPLPWLRSHGLDPT